MTATATPVAESAAPAGPSAFAASVSSHAAASAAALRVLRCIAVFEALKAVLAVAAVVGLLGPARHGLHHLAIALIGRIGLHRGLHVPASTVEAIDHWLSADRLPVLMAAVGYVALRLAEAYGMWHARPWGERLGALSGALYVPFEAHHLVHRPGALAAAVLAGNLAVVAFLCWRVRRGQQGTHAGPLPAAVAGPRSGG